MLSSVWQYSLAVLMGPPALSYIPIRIGIADGTSILPIDAITGLVTGASVVRHAHFLRWRWLLRLLEGSHSKG